MKGRRPASWPNGWRAWRRSGRSSSARRRGGAAWWPARGVSRRSRRILVIDDPAPNPPSEAAPASNGHVLADEPPMRPELVLPDAAEPSDEALDDIDALEDIDALDALELDDAAALDGVAPNGDHGLGTNGANGAMLLPDLEPALHAAEAELEAEPESGRAAPTAADIEGLEDHVRMYLREIGLVPLLKWEDEKRLARQMEEGEYLDELQTQLERERARAVDAAELLTRAYELWCQNYRYIGCLYPPAEPTAPALTKTYERLGALAALPDEQAELAAGAAGTPPAEARDRLFELSVLCRLLPPEIRYMAAEEVARSGAPTAPEVVEDWLVRRGPEVERYSSDI